MISLNSLFQYFIAKIRLQLMKGTFQKKQD